MRIISWSGTQRRIESGTRGLRWQDDELVACRRKGTGKPLHERRIRVRDQSVGGQGFNNWIVQDLPSLEANRSGTLHFVIPDRLSDAALRIQVQDGRDDDGIVHLKAELSNWLLRLIAPSIEVAYDRDTGRLVRYSGNSNLASEDGGVMEVDIVYEVPEQMAGGAPGHADS